MLFGLKLRGNSADNQTSLSRSDIAEFIRTNTRLQPVPHAPEIVLFLADESVPLWRKTEPELAGIGLPSPFWAFAWAGGQALARYVLDDPNVVAGSRILDLGSGSGLAGIAAALAGAAPVIACEIDPFAEAAIALNSEANGVYLEVLARDPLADRPPAEARYDVILAGDLFYETATADRMLAFLAAHARVGTKVLIGDPGRAYLPKQQLRPVIEYSIEPTRELEDMEVRRAAVWTLV
jgi:predicted nicotinamide N-methyase